MEEMIRIIVMEKGRTRAASFYISILIAYLEQYNWQEAEKTIALLESLPLLACESRALAYLSVLCEYEERRKIDALVRYLSCAKG